MLPRIVLAYALALPALLWLAAGEAERLPRYRLHVALASTASGVLQVFYDTGRGFNEQQSLTAPLQRSAAPHVYEWDLRPDRYQNLRVDVADGPGRYRIDRIAFLRADGSVVAEIPVARAEVSALVVLPSSPGTFHVESPPGASDPNLRYSLPGRVDLSPAGFAGRVARRFLLVWVGLFAALSLVHVTVRRPAGTIGMDRRLGMIASRPPWQLVAAAALAGTTLATYPVLFLGRSFFSPNNGMTRMVYDTPPFVPGSRDVVMEEMRKSDTVAAMWQFLPYVSIQRRALAAGDLALWNRYNGGGRPLVAQGQSFLGDPLHWIALTVPDLAWGMDLKTVAHRFVFALGVGLAALTATGNWWAAALVAFSAPFVGVYAFRFNNPAAFSLTYAPWILLGWFHLARARSNGLRASAVVLLALATSCMLLGSTPKDGAVGAAMAWVAGCLVVLLSGADRLRHLLAAAGAGVAVLLVTAPQWVVFLRTLDLSITRYDVPAADFAGLPHSVSLLLGPVAPGELLPGLHALALVLLLAAFASARRTVSQPMVLACAIAGAIALGIAFGAVPASWITGTPFLGRISHVHDVFISAAVPLLLVGCAAGAATLFSSRPRALLVAGLCGLVAWRIMIRVQYLAPPSGFEPYAAFAVLSAAVLLPVLAHRRFETETWTVRLAAVLLLGAVLLPLGTHLETGRPPIDELLVQPRPRVALEARSPALDAALGLQPARVVGLGWLLSPGASGLHGLESIGGADALRLPRFEDLLDTAGVWRGWTWLTRVSGPDAAVLFSPLLDMLGVEALLTGAAVPTPDTAPVSMSGPDRVRIERRPHAWPRAFFTDGVRSYASVADLLDQATAHAGPIAGVAAGDAAGVSGLEGLTKPASVSVAASRYVLSANRTQFTVSAPSPGVAVLMENFLPEDFRATLNGRRVEYFRVNHAFKGIVIPAAGEWEVVFEYRPKDWTLLLGLSGATLGLLGGLFVYSRRIR